MECPPLYHYLICQGADDAQGSVRIGHAVQDSQTDSDIESTDLGKVWAKQVALDELHCRWLEEVDDEVSLLDSLGIDVYSNDLASA